MVQAGSNYEKNWRSKISLDCPFKYNFPGPQADYVGEENSGQAGEVGNHLPNMSEDANRVYAEV